MMVYEDRYGNPDIIAPTFDDRKKRDLYQRLSKERSKTSREKLRSSTKGKTLFKNNQIDEYGWTNNEVFAGYLRAESANKNDKISMKKELRWNQRFAMPISTYNEAVFKKYRLSFEEI